MSVCCLAIISIIGYDCKKLILYNSLPQLGINIHDDWPYLLKINSSRPVLVVTCTCDLNDMNTLIPWELVYWE